MGLNKREPTIIRYRTSWSILKIQSRLLLRAPQKMSVSLNKFYLTLANIHFDFHFYHTRSSNLPVPIHSTVNFMVSSRLRWLENIWHIRRIFGTLSIVTPHVRGHYKVLEPLPPPPVPLWVGQEPLPCPPALPPASAPPEESTWKVPILWKEPFQNCCPSLITSTPCVGHIWTSRCLRIKHVVQVNFPLLRLSTLPIQEYLDILWIVNLSINENH